MYSMYIIDRHVFIYNTEMSRHLTLMLMYIIINIMLCKIAIITDYRLDFAVTFRSRCEGGFITASSVRQ